MLMHEIRLKRVYEVPSPDDGVRVLVDRLWPRGIRKADLPYDAWPKEITPSPELRTEQPAYAGVEIEIIDENEQPELAKAYAKDYYYVPSLFIEGHKVYEAQPGQDYDTIKAAVADAFEQAK